MFKALAKAIRSAACAGSPDRIERTVDAAIDAVQSGDLARIEAAYQDLAPLNTGSVFAELFLQADDATAGMDESALLHAVELPIPPNPREMLQAAADRDLAALQRAVESERLEKVLASLLVLVAALKEARPRVASAAV